MVMTSASGVKMPEFKSCLVPLLVIGPWARSSFLISKMGRAVELSSVVLRVLVVNHVRCLAKCLVPRRHSAGMRVPGRGGS